MFLFACTIPCSHNLYAKEYKIALIHSYQEDYTQAEFINQLFQDGLRNNGLSFTLKVYYLDCERYESKEEEARISDFADEIRQWNADLIAVLDDQATYSLMACNNPYVNNIPVVFSGVNYPNADLLAKFPNITGYADKPDYLETCKMIERIMGKVRINLLNGRTVMDKMIWKDLTAQCIGENISIVQWYRESGYPISARMAISDKESSAMPLREKFTEYNQLDTTTIFRMSSDTVAARDLLWLASGVFKYSLFLYTKRDYTTLRIGSLFDNPGFETINEGFGAKEYMLGGYFATIETQLKDMTKGIAHRLEGKIPEQQITYCKKEHVVNWNVLNKYNIPMESIPAEYTIMYMPATVKYYTYLVILYTVIAFLGISGIAYLIYMFNREKKRKLAAQEYLRYEHESLTLAIEGGHTYAWTFDGHSIAPDALFYDFMKRPHLPIPIDEFALYIHPEERKSFLKNAASIVLNTRRTSQYRCKFDSLEYEWWELRYSVINSDKQNLIVAGLLLNIQEIKNNEAELIRARQLAEQAELKQSFLANMSHEIRTPLNAIAGFSNLLANDEEISNEEKQEFSAIINNNTNQLLKLVNDILEISRIESGNMSFTCEDCGVTQLLDSIYQTHQLLIKPPVEFIREFSDEDVTVHIDHTRLTQVITNFLNNANKFTKQGHIKLGYFCVNELKEVHIYVEDTGAGIPQAELNIIFERFYKRNEFAQGVGLGLSICKVIVGKLDGHIEVKSEENKGSRFTVVLPYL